LRSIYYFIDAITLSPRGQRLQASANSQAKAVSLPTNSNDTQSSTNQAIQHHPNDQSRRSITLQARAFSPQAETAIEKII